MDEFAAALAAPALLLAASDDAPSLRQPASTEPNRATLRIDDPHFILTTPNQPWRGSRGPRGHTRTRNTRCALRWWLGRSGRSRPLVVRSIPSDRTARPLVQPATLVGDGRCRSAAVRNPRVNRAEVGDPALVHRSSSPRSQSRRCPVQPRHRPTGCASRGPIARGPRGALRPAQPRWTPGAAKARRPAARPQLSACGPSARISANTLVATSIASRTSGAPT